MKKLKYLIVVAITFCMFGITNVKATDIAISGESVFRKSATEATINFKSNIDGNIYYVINGNSSASIEDIVIGENGGNIIRNLTKTINIPSNLLSSGAKYAHIVGKDESGNFTNILTVAMPKDLYYYDDFEAYNVNAYPNFFTIKHNGGNTSLQQVVNLNGNKVFSAYGTYGIGLEERVQINALTTGYAVFEATISATTIPTDFNFGGLVIGKDSDNRNVIVQVKQQSKKFSALNYSSDVLFESNKDYHVKIIVDIANKKYNYYINGIKANVNPINAEPFTELTSFGLYNGSGTISYDNIKFYSQSTDPEVHLITKGAEVNGTFTLDKTSARMNEIITITPTPATGYRIKSVKINNNESGITNNGINYTYTVKDEDANVIVEFEKIPFTITVNAVTGATITPGNTINVGYGDNQEVTITANSGYRLTSVKVNDVEKINTLTKNVLTLTDINEDKNITITVEKIKYTVINGDNQKHIVGKKENAVFKIDADKSLFNKVYLNNKELDSRFYTVTEGSTIITLKQELLNNLLPGTYKLKATFNDGGIADTTFVIVGITKDNPQTSDPIVLSIIIGCISLICLLGTGIYAKKRFN